MDVCILRELTPAEVRRRLNGFKKKYVEDWENWLAMADADRVSTFGAIMRKWQGTRPLPMRRPAAEATHEPPFMDDLLRESSLIQKSLGSLSLASFPEANSSQLDALHRLWTTFSQLPRREKASCVGITKAIMLATDGRIGPAFDSIVRQKLGLKSLLKSSQEWIAILEAISEDILVFESKHQCRFSEIAPERFRGYPAGRLYDMLLGPGAAESISPPS